MKNAMKCYINPIDFQHDIWKLAKQIFDRKWQPDIMIALWRGGANVGVGVYEFLSFRGWKFDHTCVKCSSYTNIGEREDKVKFDDAAEYIFSKITPSQKVLVVDDVFDTGKTVETVKNRLAHADLRSACVYWKELNNLTQIKPDYFVSKSDSWLVFPHELQGLSETEIEEKDPFLTCL
jgi:hypoxanthine phosphoribosyltransferase